MSMCFIENVNKHLQIDPASIIASLLGGANSRKSKRYDKAINSPWADKKRTLHIHMFVESLCIVIQKHIL